MGDTKLDAAIEGTKKIGGTMNQAVLAIDVCSILLMDNLDIGSLSSSINNFPILSRSLLRIL